MSNTRFFLRIRIQPDKQADYADGKDREVLYFIKTLRDKLPTQPLYPLKSLYTPEQLPEAKRQAQEDYLTTVSYVYQKAMQLEKPEDFKKFFNEVSAAKLPNSRISFHGQNPVG